MKKRVVIGAILCSMLLVGIAWQHAPVTFASGCPVYGYNYCVELWLNSGQLYALDGYVFPTDPYNLQPCVNTGDPSLCWMVRSETNTTFTADPMFTQATGEDTCDGGYTWVEHQTSESYVTSPTKLAIGSDTYGLYSDCGPSGNHIYALDTFHWEWQGSDREGTSRWYQFD